MPHKLKPFTMPKTLVGCADLLYKLRQERYSIQTIVDEYKKQEAQLRDRLINELPKGEASGIQGKLARVSIVTKTSPQADDWDKIHAYVVKNAAWDLIQKRLLNSAVQERWDDGVDIPGIKVNSYSDISLSKRK